MLKRKINVQVIILKVKTYKTCKKDMNEMLFITSNFFKTIVDIDTIFLFIKRNEESLTYVSKNFSTDKLRITCTIFEQQGFQ